LAVSYTAADNCAVSGGKVKITGAGECTITASQVGDDDYNPAPDVTRHFTIARAVQSITFGDLADKTYGDADFSLGATASSGLAVAYAASGPCSVSGKTARITGAGSCTITATQPGDGNYKPADDVSKTFAIARAQQSIAFDSIGDATFGDADIAISASSSSKLPVYLIASSGPCAVDSTTSPANVHLVGAGTCTITASQPGDVNYLAADDVSHSFSIAKAKQTISFDSLADKVSGDRDFTVAATSSSGLPVSFAAVGSCTVEGTTVHIAGVGTCTVTASQAGSADYEAAPSVSQAFNVAWPWRGFFQPVDNGAVNVVKAGSAVPVKFSLGGARGLAILAAGYPQSAKVSCESGARQDAIEQTSTAGRSSLTFDATAGQYVYVWKTSSAWAGTCRTLTVKLVDNTVHTAAFRLR
jgi:hypothetical protein